MSIVVDASIAVTWFAEEPGSAAASQLLAGTEQLIVPDLLFVETANALWKKHAAGDLDAAAVEQSITTLLAGDFTVVPAADFLKEASALAVALRHPVYDCAYLALAQRYSATLATADKRLSALAKGLKNPPVAMWRAKG